MTRLRLRRPACASWTCVSPLHQTLAGARRIVEGLVPAREARAALAWLIRQAEREGRLQVNVEPLDNFGMPATEAERIARQLDVPMLAVLASFSQRVRVRVRYGT